MDQLQWIPFVVAQLVRLVEAGERVVVTDLVPAVDGMLLQVQLDEALNRSLKAHGKGS